MLGRQKETIK